MEIYSAFNIGCRRKMASLSNKTLIGVLWNFAEQISVKGISVAVTLVLAYFLSPEDFGLVAMMAVFISIATSLMDSGFRQALIRLPEVSQEDFNTAFFANILLGIISYFLLFICAPAIAGFYGENQLIPLIRVAGVVVIINVFQVVQYACLSREMNFKAQFRAALPATIISAIVALGFAYYGFGVWALVAQMLTSAFFVAIFLWLQNLWRPNLAWSKASLKSMYRFGYKLFLSNLLDTGFKNMFVVVIAKLFSTSVAGLYFFADRIREILIYQMVSSIQKVTFPALANIQGDKERLKQSYKRVITVTTFVMFPIILFFAALAEPLFHSFLPEAWWPSVIYIQLMCLAGVLIPIHAINLNMLKVLGRSDLFLGLEVVKKALAVLILLVSYRFGVEGILLGQIISSVLAYIPNSYYSKRLINYSVTEQLADFMPTLLLAGVIAICVWLVQISLDWSALPEVLLLGAGACLSYLLVSRMLKLPALGYASHLLTNKSARNNA
ncbi:capsular polysaccharide repeat unit transporter [Methylophaga frappieri]|uniref:Capsular polysaccharide repeat unit transporter n=1 Tax=Methylophaga frappieri (strain ATCC BAA-2434 / DSM 25690 / JAM7) TaxID=754477 RepID=I1YG65_METFJ|nr:lipopolysaccharide biosynthesis protein [Methylophaga frappieri]AFJ01908.1 capsular polysaccharide repeat unit transporter [Methylophaga frappieri]